MKGTIGTILLAFVITLHNSGSNGHILRGVSEPYSKCEGLYQWMDYAMHFFKSMGEGEEMAKSFRYAFGIDFTDKAAVKSLACGIAGSKTLKEAAAYATGLSYDTIKDWYVREIKLVCKRGGYTSAMRILDSRIDFFLALKNKARRASSAHLVQQNFDLATLTNIMEVMQVKYGSRWVSFIVRADDEAALVKDPKKFAKDLYESNSFEDFQKNQSELSGATPVQMADFYKWISHYTVYPVDADDRHYFRVLRYITTSRDILGQLGMYELSY